MYEDGGLRSLSTMNFLATNNIFLTILEVVREHSVDEIVNSCWS